MKTLVLGASDNPDRYSNKAIKALLKHGHEVVGIGNKATTVDGIFVSKNDWTLAKDIDTITLYLNPERQKEYYDNILATAPRRVIFNPGTENEALEHILREHHIIAQEACTLVLLAVGKYEQ